MDDRSQVVRKYGKGEARSAPFLPETDREIFPVNVNNLGYSAFGFPEIKPGYRVTEISPGAPKYTLVTPRIAQRPDAEE